MRDDSLYALTWSRDLVDWSGDVDDAIVADGDEVTFGPFPNPSDRGDGGASSSLFFRGEER